MNIQKKMTLLTIFLWLFILALIAGPIRWEFAHTYAHWVEGLGNNLPVPTTIIGLPILGLDYSGLSSVFLSSIIWLVIWGIPLFLLILFARASQAEQIRDIAIFGGGLYLCVFTGICAYLIFSLWLPFAYLG